ncbi:unnamed protein product, partial [Ectocarpus sp. 8 AP-2014]
SLRLHLRSLSCPGYSSWPAGESPALEPSGTAAGPAGDLPRSSRANGLTPRKHPICSQTRINPAVRVSGLAVLAGRERERGQGCHQGSEWSSVYTLIVDL